VTLACNWSGSPSFLLKNNLLIVYRLGKLTMNDILQYFLNREDYEITETNILQLDEQI
jgi:hypothetical protein